MEDLIAFIQARLDEMQAHAEKDLWALDQATNRADWSARYGYNLPTSLIVAGGKQVAVTVATVDGLADGEEDQHAKDAFVIARMVQTARQRAMGALADVTAKRAIVDAYVEAKAWYEEPANRGHPAGEVHGLWTAIQHIGTAYADHPGYREEWRP